MALFGRTRGRKPRILTAAGARIDLTNREAVRRLATSRTAQTWQADAWAYRDMIGELRFAGQYKARAVARVRYFPAAIIPDQDEPVPFDAEEVDLPAALMRAAEEEMARLPLDAGYRFLGVMDENLSITGECWLHGYQDESGEENWEVLSVSEVILGQDGQVSIRRAGEGTTTPVNEENEELLRLWLPHPRWGNLADSPMRALQDVCEGIILAGYEQRAVARSRVASNGIFKIPRGLALLVNSRDEAEISADDNTFMSELTAALTAPINNEGHPGSVAPVGIVGEIEDLKAFEHMRIDREASADIIEKVEQGLARLARGLDIPPEIITGMADANHWSAWQIDSSTYRYHIDPSVRAISDALTEAFLRPALLARGFALAEVRRVTIWRDAGVLTENPNRGQDAKDAFDRGAIGFTALADALGFSPADAPDDDELVRMVAIKAGVDTGTSAMLLRVALGTAMPEQQPAQPVVIQADQRPQIEPGTTPPAGTQATPQTQPAGVTASGRLLAETLVAAMQPTDSHQLQPEASRALMDLDRALLDRLQVAAEEALARGLEKAGARVRSHALKDRDVRATLNGLPVEAVAAHVSREGCLKLGVRETDLLAGVFDRFRTNWDTWVQAGIAEGVRVALRLLGLRRNDPQAQAVTDRLTHDMQARVPTAWTWLHDQLMAVADRALFNPNDVDDTPGEKSTFRVPAGVIRQALSMVGGPHPATNGDTPQLPGGIGTGGTMADTLTANGAATLGFEWIYGPYERDTFEPHLDLDGERFSSWSDNRLVPPARYGWVGPYLHPGDHGGCKCSYMPMWVTPDPDTDLAASPRSLTDRLRGLRDRWLRRTRG